MFFFKRIKQLEEQVAELKNKTQILEDRTEILAARMKKSFEEIDQLYSHLVNHEHSVAEPVTEQKPKPKQKRQRPCPNFKPKKNGKEGSETAE